MGKPNGENAISSVAQSPVVVSPSKSFKNSPQHVRADQEEIGEPPKSFSESSVHQNGVQGFPMAYMALQANEQAAQLSTAMQQLSGKGIPISNPYLFWSQLAQNNLHTLGAAAYQAQHATPMKPFGMSYCFNPLLAAANYSAMSTALPQMAKYTVMPPPGPGPSQSTPAGTGDAAPHLMVYPANYSWPNAPQGTCSDNPKLMKTQMNWIPTENSDTNIPETFSKTKTTNKRSRSEPEASLKSVVHGKPRQLLPQEVEYASIEEQLQALPSRRPKRIRRNSSAAGANRTRDSKKADARKGKNGICGAAKVKKKSKYRGVFWQTRESTWVASIMVRGVKSHLGYFSDEKTAAIEYDKAAMRLKGPSSYFNFPENISSYGLEKDQNWRRSGRTQTRKAVRSSKYRGVCWNKCNHSWKACIKLDGRNLHIGYYDDEVDAAKAYDMKAVQMKQSKAILNFPQEFLKLDLNMQRKR